MIMQIALGIVVGVFLLAAIVVFFIGIGMLIMHIRERYMEYEDELDDYTSDDDDLKIYKNL